MTGKADSDATSPRKSDDAALVRRCLNGDEAAWRELVERYSPLVYSISTRAGLSPDARDDVHQNTFLALYRGLAGLKDGQTVAKWLITTATRESWRARRRLRESSGESESWGIDPDQVAAYERAQAVNQGLRRLGGKCEELLRYLFSTSGTPDYRSAATALGIPVGSIGPTRQRCLAKLAELLGDSL